MLTPLFPSLLLLLNFANYVMDDVAVRCRGFLSTNLYLCLEINNKNVDACKNRSRVLKSFRCSEFLSPPPHFSTCLNLKILFYFFIICFLIVNLDFRAFPSPDGVANVLTNDRQMALACSLLSVAWRRRVRESCDITKASTQATVVALGTFRDFRGAVWGSASQLALHSIV
jgi:hypothetical protein